MFNKHLTFVVLSAAVAGLAVPAVFAVESASVPSVVRPRAFDVHRFENPEAVFWPAYFWLWNGALEPAVLKTQLTDMATHDARSVCVLPMPREFRPDTTANRMDVDYLSPQYFERVKAAVDDAERLGMHYWLYDEGGWPSGQAAGRVVATRPDLGPRLLRMNAEGKWSNELLKGSRPDLLNPATTSQFISLTHERYRAAVGNRFGKTIQMVFTDEPSYPTAREGREVAWTNRGDELFAKRFGYNFVDRLPTAFGNSQPASRTKEDLQTRMDAFDFWSRQFQQSYFEQLRDWCRANGVAHGGHLGGDDETLGAVRYGYGHILRPLRAMDVPGVDVIWRQVFPGKRNHHFPKYASSAAHQNGTALAFTESFCVYGNGLTPAQMKWLIDYQYVRGLNLLVMGCYPLSTDEHHMLGERPHFGPVNPLWDYLPKLHRYVARLGYLLACGEPSIDTALYYPVRDIWAKGSESPAADLHDALAQRLSEHQCDFDVIDDDLLSDSQTHVADGVLHAGRMKYRTIVVGFTEFMAAKSRERLEEFERGGGKVIRVNDAKDAEEGVRAITPTVDLQPASLNIRCSMRHWPGGGMVLLFNEGESDYRGRATVQSEGRPAAVDPSTGQFATIAGAECGKSGCVLPVDLVAGESRVLLFGDDMKATDAEAFTDASGLELSDGWEARVVKQYRVGATNYEIRSDAAAGFRPIKLGSWDAMVGPDFSGMVEYRRTVRIPDVWAGHRLRLNLGKFDYAAKVCVDGKEIDTVLWPPFETDFEVPEGKNEFVLRIEIANTLANELTSERVRSAWAQQKGPGWPGPYHQRAIEFEKESRSGGLFGPVELKLIVDNAKSK